MKTRDVKVGAIVEWNMARGVKGIINGINDYGVIVYLTKTNKEVTLPKTQLTLITKA